MLGADQLRGNARVAPASQDYYKGEVAKSSAHVQEGAARGRRGARGCQEGGQGREGLWLGQDDK
eukprot:6336528-Pyramimonas_sp.AAC.1